MLTSCGKEADTTLRSSVLVSGVRFARLELGVSQLSDSSARSRALASCTCANRMTMVPGFHDTPPEYMFYPCKMDEGLVESLGAAGPAPHKLNTRSCKASLRNEKLKGIHEIHPGVTERQRYPFIKQATIHCWKRLPGFRAIYGPVGVPEIAPSPRELQDLQKQETHDLQHLQP